MVKDVAKKVNKKYGSKIAWNAADYVEYIYQVKSARIDAIYSLISEFNNWSVLSEEEENDINKIIKELKNYLNDLEGE